MRDARAWRARQIFKSIYILQLVKNITSLKKYLFYSICKQYASAGVRFAAAFWATMCKMASFANPEKAHAYAFNGIMLFYCSDG